MGGVPGTSRASFPSGSLTPSSPSFPFPVMDESGVPRSIWDGDAKAVQQCLTDIFTSVYTTCDIPENAIFGPCVLSHTSLYDSIAFVALKSTDKRTVPYIFRVRGGRQGEEVGRGEKRRREARPSPVSPGKFELRRAETEASPSLQPSLSGPRKEALWQNAALAVLEGGSTGCSTCQGRPAFLR